MQFIKQWSIQERLVCTICIATMRSKDETAYAGVENIEESMKSKVTLLIREIDFI